MPFTYNFSGVEKELISASSFNDLHAINDLLVDGFNHGGLESRQLYG